MSEPTVSGVHVYWSKRLHCFVARSLRWPVKDGVGKTREAAREMLEFHLAWLGLNSERGE